MTGKAFIRHLLEHNPEDRMTMANALEHVWLSSTDEELNRSVRFGIATQGLIEGKLSSFSQWSPNLGGF